MQPLHYMESYPSHFIAQLKRICKQRPQKASMWCRSLRLEVPVGLFVWLCIGIIGLLIILILHGHTYTIIGSSPS